MNYAVVIVGAGIVELSRAKLLHKNKRSFIILEASSQPGGRIKIETVDDFQMDNRF